jgi:hypothetical protein
MMLMIRQRLSSYAQFRCGALSLIGLLPLLACSSSDPPTGVITLTTGGEADAWSIDPAPQNVLLELVRETTRTPLANVATPVTSSIPIGSDGARGVIAKFEGTAFDGSNVVMRGSTVPFYIYGFAGIDVPLFMGRVGGFSRAPGELFFPRRQPQLAAFAQRYLLVSGGDGAQTIPAAFDVYDVSTWSVIKEQPPLPRVPESWAAVDPKVLLIDHAGATWLDLATSLASVVQAPVGLDFSQIVGGQTVRGPDDVQYIVGATRTTDEPTNQILRIDADGALKLMKLATPRLGAAATVVSGQLLVFGGSDAGAGAEVANAAGTAFKSLPFSADPSRGAAMVALDGATALLVGGRAPATDEIGGFRTLDLECTEECAPLEVAKAEFPFDRVQLFPVRQGQVLAVGEEPESGETHVLTFDTGIGHELNEFPLRTPRSGASALLLPNGQVGVVGGDALADGAPVMTVELFFPEP